MELWIAFQKAAVELVQDGLCKLCILSGSSHIVFDARRRMLDASVFNALSAWAEQAEKLKNGKKPVLTSSQYRLSC